MVLFVEKGKFMLACGWFTSVITASGAGPSVGISKPAASNTIRRSRDSNDKSLTGEPADFLTLFDIGPKSLLEMFITRSFV
jgi:hypothetical protein